jgi:hypothetical protein
MADIYVHHRVSVAPRQWRAVADAICAGGAARLAQAGGALYGIWRSQIGRPRDELTVMTVWPDGDAAQAADGDTAQAADGDTAQAADGDTARAADCLLRGVADIVGCQSEAMMPTLRPACADPPRQQGNYAFRWFETLAEHWTEFLDLCAAAWPGFEASYDSQVIGLWQCLDGGDSARRSLLMTRRPDLAMWERSKIPRGPTEEKVRRQLSRRYDLCDWTCVYTTTLLSAADRDDTVRWA